MLSCERQRSRAAARVADEMEPSVALGVGLAEDPGNFRIQAVIRGRPVLGVHLELLGDGGHAFPQCLKQSCIRRLGRHHRTRKEDHGIAGHEAR